VRPVTRRHERESHLPPLYTEPDLWELLGRLDASLAERTVSWRLPGRTVRVTDASGAHEATGPESASAAAAKAGQRVEGVFYLLAEPVGAGRHAVFLSAYRQWNEQRFRVTLTVHGSDDTEVAELAGELRHQLLSGPPYEGLDPGAVAT
jgi:hypothetical protein